MVWLYQPLLFRLGLLQPKRTVQIKDAKLCILGGASPCMPLLSVDDVEVLLSAVVAAMAPSTLVRASCRMVIRGIVELPLD